MAQSHKYVYDKGYNNTERNKKMHKNRKNRWKYCVEIKTQYIEENSKA